MARLWLVLVFTLFATFVSADDIPRIGVFGTVDSAVPLVVAGRAIDVPDGLPVISLLGAELTITQGDILAIVVTNIEGRLVAQRISEIFAVVGPVEKVTGNSAMIMGSTIHVPVDVALKSGQWVAVSGLWSGTKAITSKLRRVESGGFAQLTGAVDPVYQTLSGTEVTARNPPANGYGGDVWVISGTPQGETLGARLMSRGVFGSPVDLALWQGYASEPVASQTYIIHGSTITGSARDAQMPDAGALVARCVHKGRIVEAAPAGFDAAFDALDCIRHIQGD